MIELLKAVVLGMTEGFTEWLPVSAAAHLMLMEGILRPESGGEVLTALHAALQLGASFAALLMYWPRLNFLGGKPKKRKAAVRLCTELLVGTVPTAILGFLLFDWIQSRLRNGYLISLMLILFGAVLLIVERGRRYRKPETDLLRKLNPHMALYIGMFQVLGLIPGVSRAGAAILGALLFGFLKCLGVIYSQFEFLKDLNLPMYFYNLIPYFAVLIVLMFTSKRSRAPKAEGIPYDKGMR